MSRPPTPTPPNTPTSTSTTPEHDTLDQYHQRRRRLRHFLQIPLQLERFIGVGLFICLDIFLYLFTVLPLHIIGSLFYCVVRLIKPLHSFRFRSFSPSKISQDFSICMLFIIGTSVVFAWDLSRLYHAVRGQNLMKLYSMYQLIEILDRLLSSVGQDSIDNCTFSIKSFLLKFSRFRPLGPSLSLFHVISDHIFAFLYMSAHVSVILFQLITLNVAINSKQNSVVALLISNNFFELKSAVFKKYSKVPLFQIASSDITERFHMIVLTTMVGLQSFVDMGGFYSLLWSQLGLAFAVLLGSELAVDWAKHAFVCFYNGHSPQLYTGFKHILYNDVVSNNNENGSKHLRPSVARRIGFVPLPLACVSVRVVWESFRTGIFTCKLVYIIPIISFLFVSKYLVSSWLIYHSSKCVNQPDPELEKVQRYMLLEKRVP
ncbi:hypothetical protein RCL1_001013 [Eukaryota sp. TZLM3-RCL]